MGADLPVFVPPNLATAPKSPGGPTTGGRFAPPAYFADSSCQPVRMVVAEQYVLRQSTLLRHERIAWQACCGDEPSATSAFSTHLPE